MLAVVQINVHQDSQDSNNENNEQIFLPADDRQPSGLGVLIDDADFSGALRNLPHDDKESGKLRGDIVHHQSEQCFVCVPLGLEERREKTPDTAGGQRGQQGN